MSDKFNIAEMIGRDKLKNDFNHAKCKIEYKFTEDKYDRLDCFATAHTDEKEMRMANEIKNRDISLETYADEGFILELPKYEALMEAYEKSGYTPYYINYFTDARVVWNVATLLDVANRIIEKECTRTTAENYGDRIKKKVILIFPEEGNIRIYDDDEED